ncbi:MAG TPA: metallophosphoesterase [Baekduia sp.]|nr:metallophosphoesterase [Baekduia sp.]
MRTLVVSDLHLGGRTGVDVLRHHAVREPLLAEAARADRLVLLGDTLELRHGPAREALANARPVLEALADALAPGAQVVLVPGNHDHALLAPWLEERQAPIGLAAEVRPQRASPLARTVAGWLGRERTTVAYPGFWVREDIYATHGHYLDPHGTVPTFERLAAGVMQRLSGPVPEGDCRPEDYERVLAPLYAWVHASAQRAELGRLGPGASRAGKAYALLGGDGHRPIGARVLLAVFPLGIRGINLLGIGPLSSDLSGAALRRSALLGVGEVVARLGIEAEHLIFGHSHRAGPLPDDDVTEWRTAGGVWLHNSGNWVHEPAFTSGDGAGVGGPYAPGSAVVVEDVGPPRVVRLLEGVSLPEPDRAPGPA